MKVELSKVTAGFRWRDNIYVVMLSNLLMVMILFSLCRIGFYLFNHSFFPEMSLQHFFYLMWGGLRFDLTAILYINLLYILLLVIPLDIRFRPLYQKIVRVLFLVTNAIALAANVADFIYYRFTLKRTTADVFRQFENEENMALLWLRFLVDYWYALVFWLVCIGIMIFVSRRLRYRGPQLQNRKSYYVAGVLFIPLLAWFITVGIRGGFRHSTRPITLSNAGEYAKDPREVSIVLNTPFALLRTTGRTDIKKKNFFPEDTLTKIYSPVHELSDTLTFQPHNVVVIILESFSKEFFGFYNRDKENGTYKGYTPFLDSLLQYSRTYQYSFANGRKSIDGLPSVLASIPSLGVPYFLSPYSGDKINSLASLLKEKNYHTSFFHGAPNGSMGFQAFTNLAGVDHYYGKDEYNHDDDYDGIWGIWDDKFLSYYAEQLNTFPQPFMSSFFSVSSHHPFNIPAEFENKFKGGPLVIHRCIQYTDYALKKFFDKASKMPWYDHTLFVITADHTSSEIQFDVSRTAWGFYSIPILFFKPDHSLAGVDSTMLAQQIDIMPTVLNYMHYDKPYIAFGKDAFVNNANDFAFNYNDHVYQIFDDDYLFQFDGIKPIALYNFKKDPMLKENLISSVERSVITNFENKAKGVIQQYNNRMIENKLTVSR